MGLWNEVEDGFGGVEEKVNVGRFWIKRDDLLVRKSGMGRDKRKGVVGVGFVG